jgi:hypothetical protein
MARTKTQIKEEITAYFLDNATIQSMYNLEATKTFAQQFSLASLENILFETMAFIVFVLESFFDVKEAEIDTKLLNQKSGRLSWYRFMSLQFQYGFDLLTDSDQFNNDVATAEQIATSKIIKYAAVTEADRAGTIVVKVAGETNDELAPITAAQEIAFKAYVNEFKYAGTRISVINFLADLLFLNLTIEIDPLLLNLNGVSILEGTKPVEIALKEFLKELPFNGQLTLQSLVDKLQKVKGVKIATVVNANTSWLDPAVGDYGAQQPITIKRIPESGYFKIANFNDITYVV